MEGHFPRAIPSTQVVRFLGGGGEEEGVNKAGIRAAAASGSYALHGGGGGSGGGGGAGGGGGGGGGAAANGNNAAGVNQPHHEAKTVDFLYYPDSDDEEDGGGGGGGGGGRGGGGRDRSKWDERAFAVSCNFVDCLRSREFGDSSRFQVTTVTISTFFLTIFTIKDAFFFVFFFLLQTMRISSEYGTRHMLSNAMLREYTVSRPNMNKVFCSQWLSHRQVVFGTKCNRLMVYDVNTRHLDHISSLQSSENSVPPDTVRANLVLPNQYRQREFSDGLL